MARTRGIEAKAEACEAHRWDLTAKEARELQETLRRNIVRSWEPKDIRCIAGADVSYSKAEKKIFAAVVLLSYPGLKLQASAQAIGLARFPYIPGYLSFREGPVLAEAFKKLKLQPDVVIFDGHGEAHPRGFGLASHMGLLLDIPSIGCAKSILVGEYDEPGARRGSYNFLHHKGEQIGAALRTREGVKPVFVSIGHRIDLHKAIDFCFNSAARYRLPEPVRLAHIFVNELRAKKKAAPKARRQPY